MRGRSLTVCLVNQTYYISSGSEAICNKARKYPRGIWAIVEANWADPFGLACPEVCCKIKACEPIKYTRYDAIPMPEGVEEAGRR